MCALTLSIGQDPTWVWVHSQTVKTQNKCCVMRRFIWGYTAYKRKKKQLTNILNIQNKKGLQIKDLNYIKWTIPDRLV